MSTPNDGSAGARADGYADGLAGVVLAAGLGTRLRPLTDLRPKALCPVGNTALVDHALGRLTRHTGAGAPHVAVNTHHHPDQLRAHLAERAHLSQERPELLGTAGAVGNLRDWIGGRDVLLTNADAWLGGTDVLDDLVGGWDGQRCRLLVVGTGAPSDFGTMRYAGACLLPWRLVRELSDQPSGLYEVLWRGEEQRGRLETVAFAGTFIDCGTPQDYLRANLTTAGGCSVLGAGAHVEGIVDRCVVWPDAVVGPEEHLVGCIRAGDRHRVVTVQAGPLP